MSLYTKKNCVKNIFESGLKNFWFHKIIGPNRFKPKKIVGPKSLVKIGSVTADILLILTNVTRAKYEVFS